MNISGRFVLPADCTLVRVDELPEASRRAIEAAGEDFVISRRLGRGRSKVIDARTAQLLEAFREPTSLVDGVLAFSREQGVDPEEALEAAYPMFRDLIRAHFLVEAGSPESQPVDASLAPGQRWAGYTVVRLVQLYEDSEVYQARAADGVVVALKIARPEALERQMRALTREAAILAHLDGAISPKIIEFATFEERPFLAITWCEGVISARVAASLRSVPGHEGRRRLLDLCRRVARSYAEIHGRGVIHGDVHPGNILIGEEESITLIDFGLGVLTVTGDGTFRSARRGGVGYFFEPEYASAVLARSSPSPQASTTGEQHIVAHLLYRLLTGHGYVDFAADKQAALAQLASAPPEPFAHWGLPPWPDLEAVLTRALSINPNDRFASMAELADALERCAQPIVAPVPVATSPSAPAVLETAGAADRLIGDFLCRFNPDNPLFEGLFPQVPRCSLYYGSGGIAWFLYRLASIREDPQLLAWARLWIEKAISEAAAAGEEAYCIPRVMPFEMVGPVALYHSESGLRLLQGLIARAAGDIPSQLDAAAAYATLARTAWANPDLALGSAGVLVGFAMLYEALPDDRDVLRVAGGELADRIARELAARNDITADRTLRYSGIAHGWAGILYALLAWSRVTATPLLNAIAARLEQLADLAEPHGRGWRWPRVVRQGRGPESSEYWPSWCNGTGGMIFLWTLAHQMLGSSRYAELAEGAALNVVDCGDSVPQICCGRPGQAYGLLNLYKHTHDRRWLEEAVRKSADTIRSIEVPHDASVPMLHYSLFKGPLGAALLAADLEAAPDQSCMPAFELEGWPV